MCGIVGYLDKTGSEAELGKVVLRMLEPLVLRGPDSTGVALFQSPRDGVTGEYPAGARSGDHLKEPKYDL